MGAAPRAEGSIALAGVSLTVAALEDEGVRIAVIPHTLAATTLGGAKAGDRLNFEADVLAKYVERITQAAQAGQHALS